jgi:hypothetical protein
MGWCPECGEQYEAAIAACPRCRVVLSASRPDLDLAPVIVHRVSDAAAGALLTGLLEQHGFHCVLRSTALPGYGMVRRDWGTTSWGEILVPPGEAQEARELIADYLEALAGGGAVRDEDIEGSAPLGS